MNVRHPLCAALLLVLAAVFALPAFAAPHAGQEEEPEQPEVRFEARELAPGIHMVYAVGGFGGGNVGLLTGEDGVLLIDDSFPPLTDKLLKVVDEVAGAPVDFLVNTHVHGDHVGGNPTLGARGTWIVAHETLRERLEEDGISVGGTEIPTPPEALPVITFADGLTFHLNGQEVEVFHVADAHTDGDVIIHFGEADVIHAGDVMFNRIFPFIDLDTGGSVDGYVAAQEAILERMGPDTRIIPGHGPLANREDLQASIAMLKDARGRIQALVDEGKSLDEILAADPLAAYADWSWAFITTERMIRQVHRGLTE